MAKKHFCSSVNTGRTQSFPRVDIGSNHDLLLMSFRLHLKKIRSSKCTRIKFDLDKLQDIEVAEALKTKIGERFAPLLSLGAEEVDVNSMTATLNTVITETANEILGKLHPKKKPWVTNELLDLGDK
ncbi:uncharacterized protein V6R79_021082 [Siganus canaliculatus]